jgi:hypothetical protein
VPRPRPETPTVEGPDSSRFLQIITSRRGSQDLFQSDTNITLDISMS